MSRPGRSLIRRCLSPLYAQVVLGIIAGAIVGWLWPSLGAGLKPLSTGFIDLIKMMIAPIVFCTIVTGIAGMDSMRAVGRISAKALLYFEVLTTVAMALGLVVVNVIQPGNGLHVDPHSLSTAKLPPAATGAHTGFTDFVLGIIPTTVASAFTEGAILPVLLIAVLAGFGLHAAGAAGEGLRRGVESLSTVLFIVIRWLMRLAPIGAFGSVAFTIGHYGLRTLHHLALLVGSFWLAAALFVFVVLGAVMRLNGLRLLPFLHYIKEELLIVLGTSSTEPVLPRMMTKLEHLGAPKSVVGLTLPAGYSFNLDGTAIYLTMGAMFLTQALGVHLSPLQQLAALAVMLLTSKGAAGVAGSGFLALAATLTAIPHVPVAALTLIFGVDIFLSVGRALTSLVGNGVATLAVARWEGQLDLAHAGEVMKGLVPLPADAALPEPAAGPRLQAYPAATAN
jgi:aerobic C4-dicarboxylate transport protein